MQTPGCSSSGHPLTGELSGCNVTSLLPSLLSGQRICRRGTDLPCYKIAYFQDGGHRLTFDEARNACRSDRGELLSVETENEQHLIERFVQQLQATHGDFWIGFRRSHGYLESRSNCSWQYHWLDGSLATFRMWHTGEPSCGTQVCVAMGSQLSRPSDGLRTLPWNDDDCGTRNNFICKYSQELPRVPAERSVPQPDAPIIPTPSRNPPVTLSDEEGSHLNVVYIIFPIGSLLLLLLLASGIICCRALTRGWKERAPQAAEGCGRTLGQNVHRDIYKHRDPNLLATYRPFSGDYENLPKRDLDSGFVTNIIYETCQGQGRSCRDAGWVENEIYG
ncbi:layilin-like [Scleropages formosus]|uniref:Layilin-like n=1 Tax=Scleropages formosus TaxID=113540 RepID=A0A0P7V2E5_SCLFO|nr:layilin-like [Scleropages formosus]